MIVEESRRFIVSRLVAVCPAVALVILATTLVAGCTMSDGAPDAKKTAAAPVERESPPESRPRVSDESRPQELVTMAKFSQIQVGMSYRRVVDIIGEGGEKVLSTSMAGPNSTLYQWKDPDGGEMHAVFQDGKLVSKSQSGLKGSATTAGGPSKAKSRIPRRNVIGTWSDDSIAEGCILTIYQQHGKTMLEMRTDSGNVGYRPLIARNRRRYDVIASATGDRYVIAPNGKLEMRDNMGLIGVARRLR